MRWTEKQLAEYEQRRSKNHGAPSSAKPEQVVCHDALAAAPREEGHGPRFHIGIVSFRRRLIDPDNLCGKYFVDCLRRHNAIPDDSASVVEYSIRQEKVAKKEDERTELAVTLL